MKLPTILLAITLCGCSINREGARTRITNPDGTIEDRSTDLSTVSFLDSKNTVGKIRAANGKTHSLGATDISQESTSAGLVDLLREINKLKTP